MTKTITPVTPATIHQPDGPGDCVTADPSRALNAAGQTNTANPLKPIRIDTSQGASIRNLRRLASSLFCLIEVVKAAIGFIELRQLALLAQLHHCRSEYIRAMADTSLSEESSLQLNREVLVMNKSLWPVTKLHIEALESLFVLLVHKTTKHNR